MSNTVSFGEEPLIEIGSKLDKAIMAADPELIRAIVAAIAEIMGESEFNERFGHLMGEPNA